MKGLRVLHRQLVQAEGLTDLSQFLRLRLKQSKPDEATLPAASRRLLQRHRTLIASAAVLVMGTINDHLGTPLSAAGADIRYSAWRNPWRDETMARPQGRGRPCR